MGLKRWDILHLVMDIFQGWFKDGTCADNQHVDYRSFSALYLLLRILFASVFIGIVLNIGVIISKHLIFIADHSWTISRYSGCIISYAKAIQEKMDES